MAATIPTSPADLRYNCIAWAAEDTKRFWWPDHGYWPQGVPRDLTIEAFVQAYAILGYKKCEHGAIEKGFQKIAIFCTPDKVPTHAARQLDTGRWTSKLGKQEDVEHDLHGLARDMPWLVQIYGDVELFMKRKKRGC